MYKISKFRVFCDEQDKVYPSRCRISNTFIIVRKDTQGKNIIRRNDWLRIENITGEVVYRQAQGISSAIKKDGDYCKTNFTKEAIEFDYDTRIELGLLEANEKKDEPFFWECNLTIKPASIFEKLYHASWKHPDDGYRISYRLGLLGLATGILGLLSTVISIM